MDKIETLENGDVDQETLMHNTRNLHRIKFKPWKLALALSLNEPHMLMHFQHFRLLGPSKSIIQT